MYKNKVFLLQISPIFLGFEPTMHKHNTCNRWRLLLLPPPTTSLLNWFLLVKSDQICFLEYVELVLKKIHSCLVFSWLHLPSNNLEYQTLIILMTIFPSLIIFPFCKSNDVKFCNSQSICIKLLYYIIYYYFLLYKTDATIVQFSLLFLHAFSIFFWHWLFYKQNHFPILGRWKLDFLKEY